MNLRSKKIIFWVFGVLVMLFILVVLANYVIAQKLETKLNDFSETVDIAYKDISLNTFTGDLKLIEPQIKVYGKTTDTLNLSITLKDLAIEGFNYWAYIFGSKIKVDKLSLNAPNITYQHNNLIRAKSYHETAKQRLKQILDIGYIEIVDGTLEVYEVSDNALALKTNAIQFKTKDLVIAPTTSQPEISYSSYSLSSNALFFKISALDHLSLAALDINSNTAKFTAIKLQTQPSPSALSRLIAKERDYYNITIDSVTLNNHNFGLKKETSFFFNSPQTTIHQAQVELFRDKLVADDMSYKPLYSKMLRKLKFDLSLDSLQIKNSKIAYTEKVNTKTKGGELLFTALNADITNFGNTYKAETSIEVDAIFMKNTPLNVKWNFNVHNKNDAFIFKADIGTLHARDLNQFMTPNLNVKLEGEINRLYFTISGNNRTSQINSKLKFEDFDVIILQKDGKEKNKFLSSIVNIFVSKDSENDAKTFSYGSKAHIERDRTKSIFNFVWINLKHGLISAIVGNGKKKD